MIKEIKEVKNDLEQVVSNLEDNKLLFTNSRLQKLEKYKNDYYEAGNKNKKDILSVLIKREENSFSLYKLEIANFLNKYENDNLKSKIAKRLVCIGYKTNNEEVLVPILDKEIVYYNICKNLTKKCDNFDLEKIYNKQVSTNAVKLFLIDDSQNDYQTLDKNEKIKLFKQSKMVYDISSLYLSNPYIKREDLISALNLYYDNLNKDNETKTTKKFKDLSLKQQLPYIHDLVIGAQVMFKNTKQLNNINTCISNYITFFNERNGYKEDYQELTK